MSSERFSQLKDFDFSLNFVLLRQKSSKNANIQLGGSGVLEIL